MAINDAKAAICALSSFGYHSGLKINPSKSYVLYKSTLLATPETVAGLVVKQNDNGCLGYTGSMMDIHQG